MPEMRHMDFLFRRTVVFSILLVWGACLAGCISYEFSRQVEGTEVAVPGNNLRVGKSTLGEVLCLRGAPTRVVDLYGKNLLIYERALYQENRISVGIPFGDISGPRADVSTYGSLARYDTLALFFTPSGILETMVYEKDSTTPFLGTLFKVEEDGSNRKD
jgi:hypothetical protein